MKTQRRQQQIKLQNYSLAVIQPMHEKKMIHLSLVLVFHKISLMCTQADSSPLFGLGTLIFVLALELYCIHHISKTAFISFHLTNSPAISKFI